MTNTCLKNRSAALLKMFITMAMMMSVASSSDKVSVVVW
jgi:hypothetical protein